MYYIIVQWDGCGASLIHPDIILSAAHCNGVSSNEVLIGAFNSGSTAGGAEFRSITQRSQHPLYDDATVSHDFLVMKLDSAVRSFATTRVLVKINVADFVCALSHLCIDSRRKHLFRSIRIQQYPPPMMSYW